MFRKYFLPILSAFLLLFAILHVVRAQQAPAKVEPPLKPASSPFPLTVAGAGLVEPQTENISLGSPLAGLVAEVHVKVGQKVKRGDILFRLDDRQLQAEKKMKQAQLAAAKAQLV